MGPAAAENVPPPSDDPGEAVVLAHLLQEPERAGLVEPALELEDFLRPSHRAIFMAAHDALARRGPDQLWAATVATLASKRRLGEAGHLPYVRFLAQLRVTDTDARAAAHSVRDMTYLRRMLDAAHELHRAIDAHHLSGPSPG